MCLHVDAVGSFSRTAEWYSKEICVWLSVRVNLKSKCAFDHAQNAQIQIILRMHKVSSGPLLSIHFVIPSDSVNSGE